MSIHSEADEASTEVKKAGKLLRYSKQFVSSGDERNKRREITKTKIVCSVWPQDWFSVCSVDCLTLKSKMNNTFHSNNEKINSARHNIYCFCLFLI